MWFRASRLMVVRVPGFGVGDMGSMCHPGNLDPSS